MLLMGCSSQWQPSVSMEERLLNRIHQYYSTLQAKAYPQSDRFHTHKRPPKDTKQLNLASQLSLELVSYEIQSMRVSDMDAEVIMLLTIMERQKQFEVVMMDHWQFVENDWFVVNTGSRASDDAEKSLHQTQWHKVIEW